VVKTIGNKENERGDVGYGQGYRKAPVTNRRKIIRHILNKFSFLPINYNSKYAQKHYLTLLSLISCNKAYAEGTSNVYQNLPSGDSLLFHMKKLKEDQVIKLFELATENLVSKGRGKALLHPRTEVIMALDFTDKYYYGEYDENFVVRGLSEKGTKYRYRYATLSIVDNGVKIVVKSLPAYPTNKREDIVCKLLDYARKRFRIKLVLMDRGFYDHKILGIFDFFKINYCVMVRKNQRICATIQSIQSFGFELPYAYFYKMVNKFIHRTFICKGREEGDIVVLATNSRFSPWYLLDSYTKRWNIETSFRKINEFRLFTTSTNQTIRLFYHLFSEFMYNLWVILREFSFGSSKIIVQLFKKEIEVLVLNFEKEYG